MVGEQLGRGRSLDEIMADMRMVAEGREDGPPAARAGRRPRGGDAHRRAGGRGARGRHLARATPSAPSCRARPSRSSTASQRDPRAASSSRTGGPRAGARLPARPRHARGRDRRGRGRATSSTCSSPTGCSSRPSAATPRSEVAEMTGMDLDLARRFWRALGFPDVALDDRMFTDLDIEALVILRSMMELGVADVDTSLQLARVIGSSMARIAEAEVSPAVRGMGIAPGSGRRHGGGRGPVRAAGRPLPPRHGPPARVRVAAPRPGRGAPGHAAAQPQRQRRPCRCWRWASPTWWASPP